MKPKDIVIEHGGSFDGVKSKAHFYLPREVVMDEKKFQRLLNDLMVVGSDCAFVRHGAGWDLFRFVGQRKPYKTVSVCCRVTPHNISPHIRLEIHPDGTVNMFEKGRRHGFSTTVPAIYVRAMLNDALQKAAAKNRNKRKRK